MPKKNNAIQLLLMLMFPILCGIASLWIGRDINWDLRNYHYYNPYAFLENRMGWDIAPAQLQSFLNPLIDIPFYWMCQHLNAPTIGFIYGFIHGLNLSLIYLISTQIITFRRWNVNPIAVGIVATAAFAPGFIAELGTTFNDSLISLFVLGATLLLLQFHNQLLGGNRKAATLYLATAGLCFGFGVGLKLNAALYAISSAVALLFIIPKWRDKFGYITIYAVAGVIGGLLSSAYWFYELWTHFGNPLLPYYNHIFQSPAIEHWPFTDERFKPAAFWEYLVWPILITFNPHRVSEMKFTDYRICLVFFLFIGYAIKLGASMLEKHSTSVAERQPPITDAAKANFVLVMFVVGFLLWMVQFSIYRYIVSLELLIPLVALILIYRIFSKNELVIASVLGVICIATVSSPSWGREDWTSEYIFSEHELAETDGTVIMLGHEPISYVIPTLPKEFRFVRIESNLSLNENNELYQQAQKIVSDYSENIYVMHQENDPNINIDDSLQRFGITKYELEPVPFSVNSPEKISLFKVVPQ